MLGRDSTVILDGSASTQLKGVEEREQTLASNEWRNYIVAYKRFNDKGDPPPYDGPEPIDLSPSD